MRILAFKALRKFWDSSPAYADAEEPLRVWYKRTQKADWSSPADIKQVIGSASILKGGRVVFNIAGNKYRLVTQIDYRCKRVYIRFVGTHAQYDKIDALTINARGEM